MIRISFRLASHSVHRSLRAAPLSSRHKHSLTLASASMPRAIQPAINSQFPRIQHISTTVLGSDTEYVRSVTGNQRLIGGFGSRHFSGGPLPSNASDASSAPPKNTELKKKKDVPVDIGGEAAQGQTVSATGVTRSSAKETKPSLSVRAAALAHKAFLDFPKLAAMKTYEFFRLMIMGTCSALRLHTNSRARVFFTITY